MAMKRYVYSHVGDKLLRVEEADPSHGEYCDSCDVCLHCEWEQSCTNADGQHFWVVYGDPNDNAVGRCAECDGSGFVPINGNTYACTVCDGTGIAKEFLT